MEQSIKLYLLTKLRNSEEYSSFEKMVGMSMEKFAREFIVDRSELMEIWVNMVDQFFEEASDSAKG